MTRHERGFTLTELLITLAIAGILAMIGAPALGNLIAHTHEAGAESAITNSLRHARSVAVMHNTRVLVCPSQDGHRCQPGEDWQHGWIIALDTDHDGQPDADAPIVATQQATPAGTRVITSAGRGQIAFHPNGSAAGSNARFTICHARERDGKSVVLSNSGRARIAAPEPDRLQQCLAGIP